MASSAAGCGLPRNWVSCHDYGISPRTVAEGRRRRHRLEVVKKYTRRRGGAEHQEEVKEGGVMVEGEETNRDTVKPLLVCADCQTSKTPLWRSGPTGPKSLCNACGIRYRKRRRAEGAKGSAANDNAISLPVSGAATPTIDGEAGAISSAPEVSTEEELRRRQREKQKRVLALLMEHQKQLRKPVADAAAPAAREVAEAARLLMSLSSGNFRPFLARSLRDF